MDGCRNALDSITEVTHSLPEGSRSEQFSENAARKTEDIMSKDKYPGMFSC